MRGSYTWYTDQQVENFNKPMLDLKAKSRIDITRDTRADLESRFNLAADSPGNPNDPADIKKPPIYTTYRQHRRRDAALQPPGTDGEGQRRPHRLSGRRAQRRLDARSLRPQLQRNYGVAVRSAYEVSPGIKPFVEVGIDRRKHDQINCFCEDRDSDGRTIKGGLQFELTRKLTGEFSAGTLTREYKDPALETLRGTLIDASLIYYATPLTTLKFDAKTTVAESSIEGVSGTLTRDFTLQADHSFRRWLIGTFKVGYGNRRLHRARPRRQALFRLRRRDLQADAHHGAEGRIPPGLAALERHQRGLHREHDPVRVAVAAVKLCSCPPQREGWRAR